MGGRRAWEFGYSPHLPPLEAWKEPEQWINLQTGRPLETVEKMKLPVDDRGIIDTDASVQLVKDTLFVEGHDWSNGLGRVWGDVHHFYHPAHLYEPEQHDGDTTASTFRQTPSLMGRMPRLFHNAIHDFTEPPEMPSTEVMYEYRQSYLLARMAFTNLILRAQNTSEASKQFMVRRQSLLSGKITPKEPEDLIGKEILRDSFARHFSRYQESAELVRSLQEDHGMAVELPEYVYSRPQLVARKFGRSVIKEYKNYLPHFAAA